MSFLSVAVFLAVTSGFTVYTHYCSSTTLKQQSIIESHNLCKHDIDSASLHNVMDYCDDNCCAEPESNDCCTNNKEYHKISDVFVPPTIIEDDKITVNLVITVILSNINFEIERFNTEPEPTFNLPPPLSGKQIVLLYHQLKLSLT